MLPIRDATPANQAMFDPQNIYFDLESETMIELSQYLESQPVPAEQPSGLGESGGSYTIVPLSDSRFEQRLPDTPQHLHSHEWCTPLQVPVDMFPDDPSNCQDPWSPSSPVSRNSPLPFPSPAPTPEAALTNDESCVLPTFPPPDPSLFPNGKDGLLELAEATMGAEATGKMTPLIKEELRYQIQSKRRNTGLSDLVAEYKEPKPEVLTSVDMVRRERRKLSNRRAATKCRERKKMANKKVHEDLQREQAANKRLLSEIEVLKADRTRLQCEMEDHLAVCNHR